MVTGILKILKVDEVCDERIFNLRHESAGAAHICSHPIPSYSFIDHGM